MSCDPSLVALLSCLPVHLSSYTNVGCDSCQSTDITVIFSAWTPVVVNDPVPVPTVQFPVYQKRKKRPFFDCRCVKLSDLQKHESLY